MVVVVDPFVHEEVVGLSEGPPANAALVHIGNTNRGTAFAEKVTGRINFRRGHGKLRLFQ